MNPELQTVVDRLELVERQNRGWRTLSLLAFLIAIGAVALPWLAPLPHPNEALSRHSVVEANRFVLRDLEGKPAGGMEVDRNGTIKLVLGGGYGTTGAAFLEVQRNGAVHLTLRGADGGVRATLLGTATPSLSLSPGGERSSVALTTLENGSGSLYLTDAGGRVRFRAP